MDIIKSTVSNAAEEKTKKVDLPSQTTHYKTLNDWGPKITPGTGCTLDATYKNPNAGRKFNEGIQSYHEGGCALGHSLSASAAKDDQMVDITSSGRLAAERNDSTIEVKLQSDDILNVQSIPPDACRNGCSSNDKCQAWVATNGTCIHHNDNIRNTAGDIKGVPTEGVRMHVKDASISTNKSCHGPYTQRWPDDECHETVVMGRENFLQSNDNITLVGLYTRNQHNIILPPRNRSLLNYVQEDK